MTFLLAASGAAAGMADPPVLSMIVLGLIMVATYIVIAFEWAHKAVAAMTGAIIAVVAALAFGIFPIPEGERIAYKWVHHIIGHELGVLGVLVGTSILVDVASSSGLFHFIAVKIVKRTRGDPDRLFLFLVITTMAFVTLLTIAPGTLIVASLALVVAKALKLDAKPYIMAVAIVANSGALMTLASGICTLMLGSAARLPYVSFFRVATPMALISAGIAFFVVKRFYRHLITAPGTAEERAAAVAKFDEWALVKDKRVFYRCAIILGLTIVGFATAQTLKIGLDLVAITGGIAALLFSGQDVEKAIKQVKWPVVLFFIGLFVVIGAVERTGLLTKLANGMLGLSGGNVTITMLVLGVFVLFLSGIVDNIPVAATLIPIVRTLETQGLAVDPFWWTLIICANLGGNSTPVGSISSVIALSALEKEAGVKVGWGEFIKVGGTVLAVQGVVALSYLYAFSKLGLFPVR